MTNRLSVRAAIKTLLKSTDLLYILTWRDIRVRYKQSVMGFLWAILTPMLVTGAALLIRIGMARYRGTEVTSVEIQGIMVRAVIWTFFSSAIRFGTYSLINNTSLVTKVAFPKEVFPISAILSSVFDFLVATTAVVAVLLFLGWSPSAYALLAVPLLAILFALTTGLALLFATANLFYRDVRYLVEIVLTYAIFLTPVLYEADFVGEWKNILMLNPLSPVLEGLVDVVIRERLPDLAWTSYGTSIALVALFAGYWSFKTLESKFAENI